MKRLNKLKYFTMAIVLFSFIAAGALGSCRDQKKEEKTEEQAEHPEGNEHPEGSEHPEGGEHPEGEEHPAKDSVSG